LITGIQGEPLTVREELQAWFPECDVDAKVQQAEGFLRNLEQFLVPALLGVLGRLAEAVERLERLPPIPYERALIDHGQHPTIARLLAHYVIHLTADEMARLERRRQLVRAVRFLAKPWRSSRAIRTEAARLVSAPDLWSWSHFTLESGHSETQFWEALEAAALGDPAACRRAAQIAAAIVPHLSVRRGPRTKPASRAHELLLMYLNGQSQSTSYTWDDLSGDFIDPMTLATRISFEDPDFDPRPARRRQKRRAPRASGR
jgi:hypothetical protein